MSQQTRPGRRASGRAKSPLSAGLAALFAVGRETAQDRVYSQLRQALIHGSFDAGEAFPVGEVAARMSVSSMPVREALARLVSERALEAMPNRRVRVPLLTHERARDIARARVLVEGELAICALPNLTDSDLEHLEAMTDEYDSACGESEVAFANHAFHFALYRRANSPVMLTIATSLWMQAGPFVRAASRLHRPEVDQEANHHHRGILQAIREQDVSVLVSELTADITQSFELLECLGAELLGTASDCNDE